MASLQPSLALSRDSGILGKVALEKEEIPWRTLQMDNFMIRFGDQVHHFLLMLDEASGYAVTREFAVHSEDGDQNITAKTLEILQQNWFQYLGAPERIRCDLEGAFRGDLLESVCKERGVELTFCPAEHHESVGDVERRVGELKKKMTAHWRSETESTPGQAAAEMCGAHSRVARVGGFSPMRWAFGRDIDDGSGDNLALLSAQGDTSSEMYKNFQARLRAESRYGELQAQARISRALNSKAQRSNQFLPGDLVYYRRFKTPADTPAHALLDTPSMKVSK
jgi:hypothetical protein